MGISETSNTDFQTCNFGLALSGGGYRAALFHLGALRRLNEINWLNRVERITSVSGGSLLLGYILSKSPTVFDRKSTKLSNEDWEKNVSAPVRQFVKNDLRTVQTIQNMTVNLFMRRDRRLDNTISRLSKLYGGQKLSDFPYTANGQWPEIYILATDIVNGQAFRFSNNPKQSAHRKLQLCDLSFLPLYNVCSISASFPPIFGPVHLKRVLAKYAPDEFPDKLSEMLSDVMLIDGGLYDNLGINLIATSQKKFVRLFSDAGNPFKPSEKGTKSIFVVARYLQLMSDFIGRLNVQRVKMIEKNDYAFWSSQFAAKIKTHEGLGYSKSIVDDFLRNVRTDLDRFTTSEAKILENHGYAQAELALKKEFGSHYLALNLPKANWPHPENEYTEESRIVPILKRASKRKKLSSLLELKLVY